MRRKLRSEICDDRPVLSFYKRLDLAFAFDHKSNCHGLYTASGKLAANCFPKYRRDLISNKAVEYAASLLSIDEILVYLFRFLECILDRVFRDLIEHHAI